MRFTPLYRSSFFSLARARRGGPVALLLSRRTAPAMHFTPLHRSSFARLPEREWGGPTALLLSRRTAPAMHFTPLHRSTFGLLPKQEGEDLLRFFYQGVPYQQCILLPSIARPLVACQSKKGRTCCASLIKAYRTRNAFYSPP